MSSTTPKTFTLTNKVTVPSPVDARLGGDAEFPLSAEKAQVSMDEEGYITVTLIVDQDDYLEAYVAGQLYPYDAWDHFDYVHDLAFGSNFRMPAYDCSIEIVGVTDDHAGFIIRYTTHIGDFFKGSETATCRHCGNGISPDPDNDWIHNESEGVACGLPVNQGNDDTYYAQP